MLCPLNPFAEIVKPLDCKSPFVARPCSMITSSKTAAFLSAKLHRQNPNGFLPDTHILLTTHESTQAVNPKDTNYAKLVPDMTT